MPTTHRSTPQLSKSRFLAGLQCLKRLYLECYQRELADPADESRQVILDAGTSVGDLARERFPGGILVEQAYFEHRQAERATKTLLQDTSVPALYEPAFTHQGIRTRVDILRRTGSSEFDLIEVKSTTGAKDIHVPDVAVQLHAVEGSGLTVDRAYVMHINREYVYGGGTYDLEELFELTDVTDATRAFMQEEMPDSLTGMWEALRGDETPDIETGRHCTSPYRCPFFGHCHSGEAEHPLRKLPGLRQAAHGRLKAAGIADIEGIPTDFPGLSNVQLRVRNSVVAGRPFVGPDLASRLADVKFPASFLDFETLSPAIPLYPGTRPYQTIPFQWSLHVRDLTGETRHDSFLHDGRDDPRESFVVSLLEALPKEGSIVAYSAYEKTVLKGLAAALPQYEAELLTLCDRVVDLLKIVRNNYYHPGFHGSFSIKSVTPALIPELAYYDLDISDGAAAAASYARILNDDLPMSEMNRLREALLAYCARDTEAMVSVYETLLEESRRHICDSIER